MLELLDELEDAIITSDLDHRGNLELRRLVAKMISHETQRVKVMKLLTETLVQLRVDVKYLLFDVEATRRERDALKDG